MKFVQKEWEKRIEQKTGQPFSPKCPLCGAASFEIIPGGIMQIIGDPGRAALMAQIGRPFPHIVMLGMVCRVCGYVHFFDSSIICEQETPEEIEEMERQAREQERAEESRIAIVSDGQAQQILNQIRGGKK